MKQIEYYSIIILSIIIFVLLLYCIIKLMNKKKVKEHKNKETFVGSTNRDNSAYTQELALDKLPLLNENGEFDDITLPDGMIVPIVGGPSKAEIMDGWVLCDGTNGTPDLRGRFIRMATLGHQQDDIFEYAINERGGSDIPSTSSSNDAQN